MKMGIFDLFKRKEKVEQTVVSNEKVGEDIKKSAEPVKSKKKSDKDIATQKGEPYIAILSMDVDPNNINAGSFEFDWNDKFISNLSRAGYQGKTDADLVDQWFQTVCRNVVLETYEQAEAIDNSMRFTQSRDIGDGRREHS
jgi:hypothetical protein